VLLGTFYTLLIFLVFIGFGTPFRRLILNFYASHEPSRPATDFFRSGLWGLALFTFFCILAHFFVSMNSIITMAIAGLGLLLAIQPTFYFCRSFYKQSRTTFFYSLFGFLFVLVLITGYTIDHRFFGDIVNYHLGSTLWAKDSNIVIGLGNLHNRFAFNSIWHLLSALASGNLDPLTYVNYLPGSVLLLMIGLLVSESQDSSQKYLKAYAISILFIAIFVWGKHPLFYGVGAPYPDFGAAIMTLLFYFYFLVFLMEKSNQPTNQFKSEEILFALATAVLAIAFKVSQIPLVLIFAFYFIRNVKSHPINIAKSLLLFFPLVLLFLRFFMLSGCWVFPAAGTCFPNTFWQLPIDQTKELAGIITGWARSPVVDYVTVINNWSWLGQWSQQLFEKPYFIFSSIIIALFILGFYWLKDTRIELAKTYPWLIILFVSILFWFIKAPDIRFASGTWITLTAWCATQIYLHFGLRLQKIVRVLVLILALIGIQDFIRITEQGFKNSPIAFVGYGENEACALSHHVSQHGVAYTIPQCLENQEVGCRLHLQPCAEKLQPYLKEGQIGIWRFYRTEN
jgi:hypothetical protein